MKLLSFEGYKMLSESTKTFEANLDKTLNESIGAALGSPIKFARIKKSAKKYQQALVQVAINNLDFEKKKAAGNLDKDKKDVLTAAMNQKNQALKDQASAISDKMDQLATTAGLKKVASIAKNKSKMSAAETALKTADGEEAKALKLKIKGLNSKVAADQKQLSDYEKKTDDASDQNLDNVKTTDKVDTSETTDKVDTSETTDKVDTPETTDKVDTPETTDKGDTPKVKGIKDKIKDYKGGIEDLKDKKDKSSKDKVEMLQTALSKAEENLEKLVKNESVKYIPESVSEKFRRLTENKS